MKCLFISEIAALCGYNPYKTPEEVKQSMNKRQIKQSPEAAIFKAKYTSIKKNKESVSQSDVSKYLDSVVDISDVEYKSTDKLLRELNKTSKISVNKDNYEAFKNEIVDKFKDGGFTDNDVKIAICSNIIIQDELNKNKDLRTVYGELEEDTRCEYTRRRQMPVKRKLGDIMIYGRVDGMENGRILEIKSRTSYRIFHADEPPIYDKIQAMLYCWAADIDECIIRENYMDKEKETIIKIDKDLLNDIFKKINEEFN